MYADVCVLWLNHDDADATYKHRMWFAVSLTRPFCLKWLVFSRSVSSMHSSPKAVTSWVNIQYIPVEVDGGCSCCSPTLLWWRADNSEEEQWSCCVLAVYIHVWVVCMLPRAVPAYSLTGRRCARGPGAGILCLHRRRACCSLPYDTGRLAVVHRHRMVSGGLCGVVGLALLALHDGRCGD